MPRSDLQWKYVCLETVDENIASCQISFVNLLSKCYCCVKYHICEGQHYTRIYGILKFEKYFVILMDALATISPEREKLKIISQIFFELEIIFYIQTSFWWISLDWGQWFESTFLMSKNSFKKSKKISKTEIWKIFWSFSFHNRLEFIIYSEQNWSWRLKSHSIFYFIFEAAFQTIIY